MKNLLLADCDIEELQPLREGLEAASKRQFDVRIIRGNIEVNKHRKGRRSDLIRYFWYFAAPVSLLRSAKKYEIIVCWQQFYALVMSFYCNLLHLKKRTRLIACNFTYKEKTGRTAKLYRWFMQKCLSGDYLDFIHVLSSEYADIISRSFQFDRGRILVTPFGIPDEYDKYHALPVPENESGSGYFFAIGRSNRDYDFLIRAWEGLSQRLIIASDTYRGTTINPYITIRRDIGADAQYAWIANCKALILPIDDGTICSGDTVLLTGMSLNKIVVATKPSTLAEMYIEEGVNGIAVAKEEAAFQQVIVAISDGKYDALEQTARASFLERFSRESLGRNIGKSI